MSWKFGQTQVGPQHARAALRNHYIRRVAGVCREGKRGGIGGVRRGTVGAKPPAIDSHPQSDIALDNGGQEQSSRAVLYSSTRSREMGVLQDLLLELGDGTVPGPHGSQLG